MSGLADFARAVIQTLRFSSGDPRMTAVAFATALALVAVVALSVLLWEGLWRGRHGRGSELPGRARRRGLALLIVVLSLGALYSLGLWHVSRPAVCVSCHGARVARTSVAQHARVGCSKCHRRPGVIGFAIWHVDYARWVAREAGWSAERRQGSAGALASSAGCLQCHRDITEGTKVTGSVRIRHADLLHLPCTDCHGDAGHGGAGAVEAPTMTVCTQCHDGRKAEAECSVCHVGDIAFAGGIKSDRAAAAKVSSSFGTDCRGCHETESCKSCHGLVMPHPPGWVPGHAREGLLSKRTCWRCHPGPETRVGVSYPYAMCNECHRFPGPHGSSERWIRDHGSASQKTGGPRSQPTRCGLCHRNERFCDLCHEGRRERVDYTR